MATEIERKFLVHGTPWMGIEGRHLAQGYLRGGDGTTVRVRHDGSTAKLTVKGPSTGASRPEFEYTIPLPDAKELLSLCDHGVLSKTRYVIAHEGHTWELDVFEQANRGLVVAEIELDHEDETFVRPPWLGAEVTHDARYFNAQLAVSPFTTW